MRLEDQAVATPRALCKEFGDEAVLLDLETETYFSLNAVGTRLWRLLTTAPSIGHAIDVALDEYDVAKDELERDVHLLVEALVARGLLRVGNA